MQWENDPLLLHPTVQEAVGLHHYDGIARFEREDHIVEILSNAHLHPFDHRLFHPLGGIAVELCNPFPEGSVVDTDPHCSVVLAAHLNEAFEIALRLFVLSSKVARVDSHLVRHLSYRNGHF